MRPKRASHFESRFPLTDCWRSGFTLVELLIAMALMTLLMAGLWSMFGVYTRVLEKSERRVTRSQLTRSLHDQLREDLRTALAPAKEKESADKRTIESTSSSFLRSTAKNSFGDFDPTMSPSEFDDADDDLGMDTSLQSNLALEITDDKWHDDRIEFFGNSHGLIIQSQLVDGSTVPGHELEESEHQIGFANPTTSSVKRTIYFYLDPEDAASQGYPSGLFRMDFTNAEFQLLPEQIDSSLIGLLEVLQPEWFREPEDARLQQEKQREEQDNLPLELSEDELREEENRFTNLRRKIDFLPEVKAFRLRYFDGRTWQSRWDARSLRSLPVAVEVSFEIENQPAVEETDNPSGMDAVDAAILKMEQADQSESDDLAEMAMELDDEIRSSQTMDITPPNRFLIFIRPAAENFDGQAEAEFTDSEILESESNR